jgi:hypothetical protein
MRRTLPTPISAEVAASTVTVPAVVEATAAASVPTVVSVLR